MCGRRHRRTIRPRMMGWSGWSPWSAPARDPAHAYRSLGSRRVACDCITPRSTDPGSMKGNPRVVRYPLPSPPSPGIPVIGQDTGPSRSRYPPLLPLRRNSSGSRKYMCHLTIGKKLHRFFKVECMVSSKRSSGNTSLSTVLYEIRKMGLPRENGLYR